MNAGRPDILSLLLAHRAAPELTFGDSNSTAPCYAAAYDNGSSAAEMIEALMTQGFRRADVKHKDSDGYGPLFYAAARGNAEAARELLKYGDDPAATTVLMDAASSGSTETARILLSSNDVNAKNQYGFPALAFAVQRGRAEMAGFLIDKGADKDAAWDQMLPHVFWTGHVNAVMRAAAACDRPTVKVLISKGADVNYRNENGYSTPGVAKLLDQNGDCTATNSTTNPLVTAGAKE